MRNTKATLHLLELRTRRMMGRLRPYDAPVLVCQPIKTAFVPVPKAANSSIRVALLQAMGRHVDEHTCIHELTRKMLVPSVQFFSVPREDWYIFTVVRDPGTRAKSAWRNKLIECDEVFHPLRRMGIDKKIDFPEFLDAIAAWPDWALNDHFKPQSLHLARPLQAPNLKIHKFERLSQVWPEVASELEVRGADRVPDLGRKNASKEAVQPYFDPELATLLRQIYGKDYDKFGYSKP